MGNNFTVDFKNRGHAGFNRPTQTRYIRKFKVRTSEQSNEDTDSIYHRRKPEGQLYYRDYNGELINVPVNGVADLGRKISKQKDPYVCAAQRYYSFLTGVKIQVANQDSDDFYKKHRSKIIEIGLNLKKHQSLKKMVVEILRTDAFQTRFPGLQTKEGGAQ